MIQMKGYKINSLEFENKVENGTQLKLQNHVKYNVNYIDSENRCVGILHFRVEDADMQPFKINIEMAAEFAFDDSDEKPDIHVVSFDQLFPFVRQIINTTTSMSGMPGLIIPMMKLNRDTVAVGKPEKSDDEGMLN